MEYRMMNVHVRDNRITFDPGKHIYHIDGIKCSTSVTGLIERFFPKFDVDRTIDQFYDNWQRRPHPKYGGKTKDEIRDGWEQEGIVGSTLGTRLHEAIETFYKGGVPFIEGVEDDYALFVDFQKDHKHLKPYRIEWRIGTDPDIGLAGTIDMCFTSDEDPPDMVHIYDWKRTKKEITKIGFRGQTGIGPLIHIPDTNYFHYCIQLNTYKYILQTYYNLRVGSMYFVKLHSSSCPAYDKHEVRDFQPEVKKLLYIMKQSRMAN